MAEDNSLTITLTGSDVDGDAITFAVVDQPAVGSLTGTAPTLTYVPPLNFFGERQRSRSVRATDSSTSPPATVSITVDPVNDLPLLGDQTFTTDEDMVLNLMLAVDDPDGDALTFNVTVPPANGTLTGTGPDFQYQPDPDFNGTDQFTVVANDPMGSSAPATISVDVTAENDAPVADAQMLSSPEDSQLDIVLTGSDVDGDALSFNVTVQPMNGALSGTAPNLQYLPDADFNGSDTFSFVANDSTENSASATIDIDITPVNDLPTATAQTVGTPEDNQLAILLTGTDVDGDALTFNVTVQPASGTLSGTAHRTCSTQPDADFNGTDTFQFVASDLVGSSDPATISDIAVSAENDLPIGNRAVCRGRGGQPARHPAQ